MPIRTASASDLEAIYRMGHDAWGEGRGLDDYLAACRASRKYAAGAWWVCAEADGRLASALLAHEIPLPLGLPAAGLGSIATAPELRGRGFASRLIGEFIRRREAAGTEVFFLFSDIAPTFYERFGFAPLDACPRKKQDSVLMVRAAQRTLASLLADPRFQAPAYF